MFIRKYWIPLTVFFLAIVGVSLYYLQTRPPKVPIVITNTLGMPSKCFDVLSSFYIP